MDKNKLAMLGAEALIGRAVDSVREVVRAYPELRKRARDAFAFLSQREAAREEEANGKSATPKRKFKFTKAQRDAIGKRTRLAWKRRNARKAAEAKSLSDAAAAKKAHAIPPVVSQTKRIGRPPKAATAPQGAE